jgi:hypothetical protein
MADIDLHKFRDDLENRPGRGSNAPPVTIRARDLDGNFAKVTVLPSEETQPEYEVEYRDDGIILSGFLPEGTNAGDIIYFTGQAWAVLPAPQNSQLRVLTIQEGNLRWLDTEDC